MRVLVVEDETAVREELKTQLIGSGFGVDVAGDGEEGLFAGLNYPLDAAVVDVGLPKRSGLEIVRCWRMQDRAFPVVVLTARSGWRNRVDGIQAGADDYIEKPFSLEELVARLRCVMRRFHGWCCPQVICGPYALDTETLTATVGGQPLDLTNFEFRLLQVLMLNAGKVLSATTLAEHIYDESADHESNVVQYFICRLRSKLDPTDRIRPIDTVYGGGYRFVVPRGRPK
jgi:two-component system response regulator PhoP